MVVRRSKHVKRLSNPSRGEGSRRGAARGRSGSALAVVVVTIFATSARAQSGSAFDDVDPGLEDAAYIGVVLPLQVGLALMPTAESAIQEPPGFDLGARRVLRWENYSLARKLSDVLLFSLMSSAVFTPLLGQWDVDESTMSGLVVGTEALLTTSLLTEVVKQLTGRQRPNEYYATDPEEPEAFLFSEGGQEYSNRSFFSGHASIAFASATMVTAFAYEYDWLDDDWRWIIPATAYSAATVTAWMRVAGDRHWLSDVVVGAFVGTGTAYLVFHIRTQ